MCGIDTFRFCRPTGGLVGVCVCLLIGVGPAVGQIVPPMDPSNVRPVPILSELDIDDDGVPDQATDSDGDGLPDNWEEGGEEAFSKDGGALPPDRFVGFPVPTAIGPGTPPTPIFSRRAVTTSADLWDTDEDGLSDFVEVFGLKFIDDNGNNILDFNYIDDNLDRSVDPTDRNGQWDPGEPVDAASEWMDLNGDGMPSIGEWPLPNFFAELNTNDPDADSTIFIIDTDGDGVGDQYLRRTDPNEQVFLLDTNGDGVGDQVVDWLTASGVTAIARPSNIVGERIYDFDGFMFTDPTSDDTDGDGDVDGEDRDPLINPETFGVDRASGFDRTGIAQTDEDLDNDGLGNGSDFGNDTLTPQRVDFPTDFDDLMRIFRPDRDRTVPESLIEDLLGADWDGNGLWRITDILEFRRNVTAACLADEVGDLDRYFVVEVGDEDHQLFVERRPPAGLNPCTDPNDLGPGPDQPTSYGQRDPNGMGFQRLLLPADRSQPFLPDVRIWAILYAWRVPGFDVDGDGYIGSPENTFVLDDRHIFDSSGMLAGLNGRVEWNPPCVLSASALLALAILVVVAPRWRRYR